jgi:hypothetical protein
VGAVEVTTTSGAWEDCAAVIYRIIRLYRVRRVTLVVPVVRLLSDYPAAH